MSTVLTKVNENAASCKFHQTKDLNKIFSDETCMSTKLTKDNENVHHASSIRPKT